MKKIMLSFVTFCMLFCTFFGISVKNVYSLEDLEFGSFEIDLTKIKEGDVYKEYQDKEKNEYVQIEVLDFKPSIAPRVGLEGESGWSGSIPNGTYTIRPTKGYGVYEYSFRMTLTVVGASVTIDRVYSPVTDCALVLGQSRELNIITKKSTPSIDALAEMSWEQTNSVVGTTVGTFSSFLGCYVSHYSTNYKVYWRI